MKTNEHIHWVYVTLTTVQVSLSPLFQPKYLKASTVPHSVRGRISNFHEAADLIFGSHLSETCSLKSCKATNAFWGSTNSIKIFETYFVPFIYDRRGFKLQLHFPSVMFPQPLVWRNRARCPRPIGEWRESGQGIWTEQTCLCRLSADCHWTTASCWLGILIIKSHQKYLYTYLNEAYPISCVSF